MNKALSDEIFDKHLKKNKIAFLNICLYTKVPKL